MPFEIDPTAFNNISESTEVHLLPCKIEFNGTAKVDQYFKPSIMPDPLISQSFTASFRGRPLEGRKILLPEGYAGVVLSEKQHDDVTDHVEDEQCVEVTHKFHDLTYWNLDLMPSANDKIMNVMKWINVANAIHGPLINNDASSQESRDDIAPSQ